MPSLREFWRGRVPRGDPTRQRADRPAFQTKFTVATLNLRGVANDELALTGVVGYEQEAPVQALAKTTFQEFPSHYSLLLINP